MAMSSAESQGPPIPLIVGVTGHRDIPPSAVPAVETIIKRVLAELRQTSSGDPCVVLTQLAIGADQLVARVALVNGWQVVPVLPMPLRFYQSDFSEIDRAGFDRLLADCSKAIELPLSRDVSAEQVAQGPARARQYARAGQWINRHCHLLLALYDGGPFSGPGGTADVVADRLSLGARDAFAVSIVQILTPRLRHTKPLENALETKTYSFEGHVSTGVDPRVLEALRNRSSITLAL